MKGRSTSGTGITRFFALTFALSWTCWALAAAFPDTATVLKILGTFGPALAALILVWPDVSRRRALLQRLVRWRMPARVYICALGLPVVGVLAALLAVQGLGGGGAIWPEPMPVFVPFVVFAYVLVFSVAGEELGWRGLALPLLIERRGPVVASLNLGAVWAIWHMPLFLLPGDFHGSIPPVLFALQIVASSFIYTHLHLVGAGSLIPAHLFHASFNASVGLFPVLPQAREGDVTALAAAVALLCIVAGAAAVALPRHAA